MNATTLKGLSMKYKHFREIEPSNKTDFIMLYFAACRSLHELENAIRRTNNGNLTCRQTWLLRHTRLKRPPYSKSNTKCTNIRFIFMFIDD